MRKVDFQQEENRRPKSYTLLPSTIDAIKKEAETQGINASRWVEAVVLAYLEEHGEP